MQTVLVKPQEWNGAVLWTAMLLSVKYLFDLILDYLCIQQRRLFAFNGNAAI